MSTGARLVLVDAGREQDISYLVQLIKHHQITAVCFVPSLLHAFLEEIDVDACRHLRRVTTGGETLSAQLEERFFARLPAARLYNGYGPTEATISATFWECRPGSGRRVVPIGRPIANVGVYVLDHDRQVAPVGMPGELYIGGVGVARGYLNQPQLTAERFVPDRCSGEPGSMLYRTGDVGRWLPDGHLEFLGRLDHQVKLRGFRIELGEIEAALRQHAAVRDAAVVLREDTRDGKRLVAYVATRFDAALSASALHSFLGRKLPRHMVPATFVMLDRLPLSPTGKVDRSALPAPDARRPALEHAFAAPRTRIEERLAGMWAQVLGLEEVGIHDNFFELGGHSLLAVRLFAQIEKVFGRKLALSTLFYGATINDLAEMLQWEHPPGPPTDARIVDVQSSGTRRPFFFVHAAVEGDGFYCYDIARHLGPDQPFFALPPHGLDGTPVPRVEDMAADNVRAIRSRQRTGPYLVGGFCKSAVVALEMARQLRHAGDRVDLLVVMAARVDNVRWPFRVTAAGVDAIGRLLDWSPSCTLARFLQARSWLDRLRRVPPSDWRIDHPLPTPARVELEYTRALAAYVPMPYRDRVACFVPAEEDFDSRWLRIAKRLAIHRVPGGHNSCVIEHVGALARQLDVCLRAVM